MIDLLRNFLSITWWQDLLNTLTFEDMQQRWALIQQAIANPQQHPLIALLALAIVLVFFLIVILTMAMWYFARVQKQNEEYELLDDEENVVRTIDKKTAKELLDSAQGIDTTAKINYAGILVAMVCVLGAGIGMGFSTRTEAFCTACHASPHEDLIESGDWPLVTAHDSLTCVNCHEPGNTLQGVTLNLFPRSTHAVYGFIQGYAQDPNVSNRTTYGTVTQASCEGCHHPSTFTRTLIINREDQVNLRVSHTEPLEAGMSCTQCHLFSERQETSVVQQGMQNCVSCHNGDRASIACANCHMADSPPDTIQRTMGSVWSRQLIFDRPDASCYDCHDPRSCDECHGTRVPHTPEYMMHVHIPGGEMIHAYDYWRIGDMCYNCHFYDNASTAGPCSACHGGDYMPPPPRYLTPRQEAILREQNIDIDAYLTQRGQRTPSPPRSEAREGQISPPQDQVDAMIGESE